MGYTDIGILGISIGGDLLHLQRSVALKSCRHYLMGILWAFWKQGSAGNMMRMISWAPGLLYRKIMQRDSLLIYH